MNLRVLSHFALLSPRIGGTVSVYEIEKRNSGQTNPDFIIGNGQPEFLGSGRDGRFAHTLRMNGNNIFDKPYVGPDLNLALGRQVIFTYSVSFR